MASNPRLRLSRSDDNGYAIVEVDSAAINVEFVVVRGITNPTCGGVTERLRLRTLARKKEIEVLS